MPDDSFDPHALGTHGEGGPTQEPEPMPVEEPGEFTRIFQSLQSPRAAGPSQPTASRAPLDISQLLRPIDGKGSSLPVPAPVVPEAMASPESFTQMFQALSPEPVVSPVIHPQENASDRLSAQPPVQDEASFTQLLNSLLRPAVNSPLPEEQSLVTDRDSILQQRSTSSAAKLDRDNEVTKIFAVPLPPLATPESAKSALQRSLPLLMLLNGALLAILGVLVYLFLKHR